LIQLLDPNHFHDKFFKIALKPPITRSASISLRPETMGQHLYKNNSQLDDMVNNVQKMAKCCSKVCKDTKLKTTGCAINKTKIFIICKRTHIVHEAKVQRNKTHLKKIN
jgi:hypothetical protein